MIVFNYYLLPGSVTLSETVSTNCWTFRVSIMLALKCQISVLGEMFKTDAILVLLLPEAIRPASVETEVCWGCLPTWALDVNGAEPVSVALGPRDSPRVGGQWCC